jgi:hypothetical protein
MLPLKSLGVCVYKSKRRVDLCAIELWYSVMKSEYRLWYSVTKLKYRL